MAYPLSRRKQVVDPALTHLREVRGAIRDRGMHRLDDVIAGGAPASVRDVVRHLALQPPVELLDRVEPAMAEPASNRH